jgi:hypothetical protein
MRKSKPHCVSLPEENNTKRPIRTKPPPTLFARTDEVTE